MYKPPRRSVPRSSSCSPGNHRRTDSMDAGRARPVRQALGIVLVFAGTAVLLDTFLRFVFAGGHPAPFADRTVGVGRPVRVEVPAVPLGPARVAATDAPVAAHRPRARAGAVTPGPTLHRCASPREDRFQLSSYRCLPWSSPPYWPRPGCRWRLEARVRTNRPDRSCRPARTGHSPRPRWTPPRSPSPAAAARNRFRCPRIR